MAAKEEEERVEGVSANLSDFLLGNFCKCKGGTALQVDVV
jgi:hypothetical protein